MFNSGMKDNATYYNKHHVEKIKGNGKKQK